MAASAHPPKRATVVKTRLFAPEANWPAGSDASPAFTPDGATVFFTHTLGDHRTIMISHRKGGHWSAPQTAPFSGVWWDIEPAMAPDGSYLVFISNRPASAGGALLTGFWGGQSRPGAGGNIWRVNRAGNGWSAPVRLPDVINSHEAIYSPSVAADGTLYFNQPDPVTRRSHIYRAQATTAGFDPPTALPISDGTIGDFDAAVAPDQSFILFSSNRAPAAAGQSLVFVSFAKAGSWTEPQAIRPLVEGQEARLSPDLKRLYVSREVPSAAGDPSSKPLSRIFETPLSRHFGLTREVPTLARK
jgi:Tol biopolymer transport system component